MLPVEIRPGIHWIGLNDRTTDLFEGLWPIKQEGVSLNSYLILDEKKVIIDATREIMAVEMLGKVQRLTDLAGIDYVVINHMEPDHSGALLALRQIAPQAVLLCSERAKRMLADFYGITDNVQAVRDGETLELGTHTLRFISTPNIHWPETMMTLETRENILFSCDAFGGFGALEGSIFDDDMDNLAYFEREALRYYTNIVASRSRPVLNALQKLAAVDVAIIAPSHGLVWRGRPRRILDLYRRWAELGAQPGEPGITLMYGSMYGDTERMAEAIGRGVQSVGVPFVSYDVTHTHPSYILADLWTRHGVLVGAPTYEGEMFPPMTAVLDMARHKKVTGKLAARFGSYGWGGGAQKAFEEIAAELKWNLAGALEFMGAPKEDDLLRGEQFGAEFARQVRDTAAS